MQRFMLKSKIHRATVTRTDLQYEGSINIDPLLMEAANIFEHEQVHVWDVTNGNRLMTYAIPGERGSGDICLNGAAARMVSEGDLVIIASYVLLPEAEAKEHKPILVQVDEKNRLGSIAIPGESD